MRKILCETQKCAPLFLKLDWKQQQQQHQHMNKYDCCALVRVFHDTLRHSSCSASHFFCARIKEINIFYFGYFWMKKFRGSLRFGCCCCGNCSSWRQQRTLLLFQRPEGIPTVVVFSLLFIVVEHFGFENILFDYINFVQLVLVQFDELKNFILFLLDPHKQMNYDDWRRNQFVNWPLFEQKMHSIRLV